MLAGELRGVEFDGVVRRAQAIAIKTFTWHFIIVPKDPVEGYDVNNVQQNYYPEKVSENSKVTTVQLSFSNSPTLLIHHIIKVQSAPPIILTLPYIYLIFFSSSLYPADNKPSFLPSAL